MRRIIVLVLLSVGACGTKETRDRMVTIPSDILATTNNTTLLVPKSCPVYAPGGGDVDVPEDPFPAHVSIICGVDAHGGTYGLATGDAPTAGPAVLPGSQELGLYIGVERGTNFTPSQRLLSGMNAGILAWSAPVKGCCAEMQPNSLLDLRVIASGPQGMMISLGRFDDKPTQVAFQLNDVALFPEPVAPQPRMPAGGWVGRFYVNGGP